MYTRKMDLASSQRVKKGTALPQTNGCQTKRFYNDCRKRPKSNFKMNYDFRLLGEITQIPHL